MSAADSLAVKHGVPSLDADGERRRRRRRRGPPAGQARRARRSCCAVPATTAATASSPPAILKRASYDVRLYLIGRRDALKGDAAEMARAGSTARSGRWTPDAVESMHLVIDAMFGAGLSRPLSALPPRWSEAVNAARVPVLAVDVPSGLDGTTGTAAGPRDRGRPHRNVLPPQARPPADAGARTVRRGHASPRSASRPRSWPRSRREPGSTRPAFGCRSIAGPSLPDTNTGAAMPSPFPASRINGRRSSRRPWRASHRRRSRDGGEPPRCGGRQRQPPDGDHAEAVRRRGRPCGNPVRRAQERRADRARRGRRRGHRPTWSARRSNPAPLSFSTPMR